MSRPSCWVVTAAVNNNLNNISDAVVWFLLGHFDLDVNVMISVAVAVHPPNAFPLQPDRLIGLTAGRNLKTHGTQV